MAASTIEARLESDTFDTSNLHVHVVNGRERLSEPFSFEVELVSTQEPVDIEGLIGTEVTLVFRREETDLRSVHGLVMEVTRGTVTERGYRAYKLHLVPRLLRLTLVHNVQIFVNTTALDVIRKKLTLFRFTEGSDFVFRLEGTLPDRNIIIQYRETDFNFVSRILEQYGAYYYFTQKDGEHTLVVDMTTNYPKKLC